MRPATYDTRVDRVLLVIPAETYRAGDFIAAAASLGVDVVVAGDGESPAAEPSTDRTLSLDLSQPEAAAEAIVVRARRTPFDAVVAVDDSGTLTAALAGARLGLRGNPPEAVAATRDKGTMRRALAVAGVPQPDHAIAHPGADVAHLAEEVGLPCVLKPVSLSASRGVLRADHPAGAAAAAERVRRILAAAGRNPAEPLLVERYVPGVEVAVEGLLRDDRLEVLAVFDKPDPLEGPYFEETIYVTPSLLAADVLERVAEVTAAAAAALALRDGPIHAELRVDGDDVRLLEVAARSIGGLCSRTLRFGLGLTLEELILRHALGRPLRTARREPTASGVMMLPIPHSGVLRAVRGQAAARAVPGIAGLEISIAPGRPVTALPEGGRYLGFLFARGDTPAHVEAALRRAQGELHIEIGRGDRQPAAA